MVLSLDPRWMARYAAQDAPQQVQPCMFCAIVKGEVPAEIVAETADTLSFLDHLPATYGHTLVIPKQHYRDLFDIPE